MKGHASRFSIALINSWRRDAQSFLNIPVPIDQFHILWIYLLNATSHPFCGRCIRSENIPCPKYSSRQTGVTDVTIVGPTT